MERVKKEVKERVMNVINKVNDDNYEISWDEKGALKFKNKIKKSEGRKARARGARFELKVRENLEWMGWIVDKWTNVVDSNQSGIRKLMPAKRKFNPKFRMFLGVGTGFPDFIAFRKVEEGKYEVIGVEVKINGYLDNKEKSMCRWLLENNVFSKILIARAIKNGRKVDIDYTDFSKKYIETQ